MYPTPVTDIDRIRHDDFDLRVFDEEGHPAAVIPDAARSSARRGVYVLHATPGSTLDVAHTAAHSRGECLKLSASHPLAKKAFRGGGRAAQSTER